MPKRHKQNRKENEINEHDNSSTEYEKANKE